MVILAIHSILGFSWDELGQIVTIATAIFGVASWANHCHNKSLARNFRQPMSKVWKSVDKLDDTVDNLRTELHHHAEDSSHSMTKLQDRYLDHEKRISWLESFVMNHKDK